VEARAIIEGRDPSLEFLSSEDMGMVSRYHAPTMEFPGLNFATCSVFGMLDHFLCD